MLSKLGSVALTWSQRVMFWLHIVAAVAIGLLMAITVVDVTRRTIVGEAIIGVIEISGFLMVTIVFLSLAYTQVRGEHVRVDVLISRLGGKTRARIDIFLLFIGAAFFGVVTWQGSLDALQALRLGEWYFWGPGGVHLYTWPARFMVPLGGFWLAVRLMIDAGRQLRFLASGNTEGKKGLGG